MSDDVVECGGLGTGDLVVDLRCPDCGPRECDVVEYERGPDGGVVRARCPGCNGELYTGGTVPLDRIRVRADLPTGEYTLRPTAGHQYGEDDGE